MQPEKKFDLLNFFYGLGAAIILIAALFKFLGWRLADTLFIIGLVGEAMIFIISGVQKVNVRKNYKWDRVFPQLKDSSERYTVTPANAEMTQQQQVQQIIDSIIQMNDSVSKLNEATHRLTKTVETLEKNYDGVTKATLEYQQEVNSLKIKIAAANDKLQEFEKYKF